MSNKNLADFAHHYISWGTDRLICGPEGQGTAVGQAKKMLEEAGELVLALAQRDDREIADGIGDVFVTLVMICERHYTGQNWIARLCGASTDYLYTAAMQGVGAVAVRVLTAVGEESLDVLPACCAMMREITAIARANNLTVEECAQLAWDEIKDRKGKMVNGKFVKEAQ